jgi:hypothetical protein
MQRSFSATSVEHAVSQNSSDSNAANFIMGISEAENSVMTVPTGAAG